jgi:hypothetical protein
MSNAFDKGYNEGRLAFRRYFAKYGPNVKQNDPRMPPNPYVGYYGFAWLNGFESELRRHVVFTPGAGGFRDIGERLAATLRQPMMSFRSSRIRTRPDRAPRGGPLRGTIRFWPC